MPVVPGTKKSTSIMRRRLEAGLSCTTSSCGGQRSSTTPKSAPSFPEARSGHMRVAASEAAVSSFSGATVRPSPSQAKAKSIGREKAEVAVCESVEHASASAAGMRSGRRRRPIT